MDNYEVILEFFNQADKPVKAGEVAQATGIEKKEAVSYTHLDVYKRQHYHHKRER